MNNNVCGTFFNLERGCKQGCPASPFLFLLLLEPLMKKIDSLNLEGVQCYGERCSFSMYADDLTVYAEKNAEIEQWKNLLRDFGSLSGLLINLDKCEQLNITQNLENCPLRPVENIKITGITYSKNAREQPDLNFHQPLLKLEKTLNYGKDGTCPSKVEF